MNRTHIRETVAIAGMLICTAAVIGQCLAGCSPSLTPDQQKTIAADGVRLAVCQFKGRECKRTGGTDCFGVYDDCVLDSGLREGSAR